MTEQELRKILYDSGVKLLDNNLVQGTWGNSSVRIDDKYMFATPSGLDYKSLKPEDMAKVDLETLEWTGRLKPTSERGIHAAVYRTRPDIGAVIHTHPTYGSIFAAARQTLPADDETAAIFGGDVRVAAYGLPGTKKLREGTLKAMEGRNACFMANHGVLCCGKDMDEAFETAYRLEKACREFIEKRVLEFTGETEYSEELLDNWFLKQPH